MSTSPRLFISYNWSTAEHEQWVIDLATARIELEESGINGNVEYPKLWKSAYGVISAQPLRGRNVIFYRDAAKPKAGMLAGHIVLSGETA